jgi:predicted  nucleic acid-binding Zn-ribbon protein
MATEQPSVSCNGCGAVFAEPTDLDPALRQPCPECGSLSRHISMRIEDSVEIHSMLSVVHKGDRPGVRGRRLVESMTGDSQSDIDGTWSHVEQVVDRIRRRYRKLVVTADGRVIRDVDEPLEDHQGRGSAKPRS